MLHSHRAFTSRVFAFSRYSCRVRTQICRQTWPGRVLFSQQSGETINGVKPPLANKSTWADRVKNTNISGGKSSLAALYSAARKPSDLSDPLRARLLPLPLRVKGHPTPCLTRDEIVNALSPLCLQGGWTVEFRLPAESDMERKTAEDCGCGPEDAADQNEKPFLKKTYQFSSIQTTDDFLADSKLLSDVGEFHHYDSYALSTSDGSFGLSSPASLTLFVQTHSATNSTGVSTPGLTMRDIRYAILLDHLYYSCCAPGANKDPTGGRALSDDLIQRLLL